MSHSTFTPAPTTTSQNIPTEKEHFGLVFTQTPDQSGFYYQLQNSNLSDTYYLSCYDSLNQQMMAFGLGARFYLSMNGDYIFISAQDSARLTATINNYINVNAGRIQNPPPLKVPPKNKCLSAHSTMINKRSLPIKEICYPSLIEEVFKSSGELLPVIFPFTDSLSVTKNPSSLFYSEVSANGGALLPPITQQSAKENDSLTDYDFIAYYKP